MLCPKCQHRNPEDNRFCGQCGCDLSKIDRTIYPREGYDDADLPLVSDFQPGGSDVHPDVPPNVAGKYAPPPAEPPQPTPIAPREIPSPRAKSSGIIFDLEPREPVRGPEQKSPEPPARYEGIHAPSFLGLADSGDPDFLDDLDEPRSHTRRNWLLIALAIVIALGVVQWRNIRQTGLEFAGTMKLNLPTKKGQQTKPAETAATDNHSENGPSNDGKPEIVVNPENNGTPADKKPAQSTDSQNENNAPASSGNAAAQQGAAPPAAQQTSAESAKNNSSTSDQKNTATKPEETANNANGAAKNSDSSDSSGENEANSPDENASAPDKSEAPAKSRVSRIAPSKRPKESSAGADELARAIQTSSPETAAKWLWASTSKGNLDAPVRLADMYATGQGVPKDCEQATVLLRSSARRGNPRASARLGMYYATGQCVQQDRAQAWHWLSLAYQHDPASDWIRQYREQLWSRMTPAERARAGNGPTANASE